MTLDLGRIHPLTGPIHVEGAEPGDILEVEILDVAPLVDFGYVVISPALGMFGSLRPDVLAPFAPFTEASQLSDPTRGRCRGAIPEDQPYNSGSPFVQLFHVRAGPEHRASPPSSAPTPAGEARIPIAPVHGHLRRRADAQGHVPHVPTQRQRRHGRQRRRPAVHQGSRLQLPVYVEGAKFSAGDGHMAQGDGEITGTAIETLMSATLRFSVIKNSVITSPRAIVPAADPTQLAMPAEMREQGYYITTGTGPDLMENAKNAVRDMIDWLVIDQQLSLHEAYALCSVAGDLKISETVDLPNWLVSMTLPRGIFA